MYQTNTSGVCSRDWRVLRQLSVRPFGQALPCERADACPYLAVWMYHASTKPTLTIVS